MYFVISIEGRPAYVCLDAHSAQQKAEAIREVFNNQAGRRSAWANVKKVKVQECFGDDAGTNDKITDMTVDEAEEIIDADYKEVE